MANESSISFLLSLWTQTKAVASVVQLKPFDNLTPAGRAKERYRRLAITTLTSTISRAVALLTTVISVPLTVEYLGAERYGLWITINSVVAMLVFADLGIGNGLLNALSEANGKEDIRIAQTYVSSAFFLLLGLAIFFAFCFSLFYPWLPWPRVFNVSSPQAVAEAGPAIAIFVGCFLINIPLGIIQRIQLGYQEGFTSNLWQGLGSLLALAGLLTVIFLRAGLPWLVLAVTGAPILAVLLNALVLFRSKYSWLRPKWRMVSSNAAKRLLRLGLLFFTLQIAGTLAYLSDNIIIAQLLGPEFVTQYAVPAKLFSFIPLILGMVLNPLWPAYGEAIARGDVIWVKQTLFRSTMIAMIISVLLSALLLVFGASIVQLWVNQDIIPSFVLLLSLAIWTALSGFSGPVAMFLNGAGVVRFQAICAILMAVANLVLSIILTQIVGLSGVVWGSIIAQIVFIIIPTVLYLPRLFSTIHFRTTSEGLE